MLKHCSLLNKYLSYHHSDIKSLSPGEVILLLAMHDVEGMRAAAGLPSSLVLYFTNGSINSRTALSACMEAMADKVRETWALLHLLVTP
jgi:phosphatidylinositol 4-kinase A